MNISFLLNRMIHLNYRRTLRDIREIAQQAQTSFAAVAVDMLECAIKYGAGPVDYQLFGFWNKTDAQRSSFITRGISTALVRKLNAKEYQRFLDDKSLQNEYYSRFLCRDWLSTRDMEPEAFFEFCGKHPCFLYKPNSSSCGQGIRKMDLGKKLPMDLYTEVKSLAPGVLEEILWQHPELEKLHPGSVNTVRVVTVVQNGLCTIVGAYLRVGRGEKIVDNLNSGGISARVEPGSGEIRFPATDRMGHIYTRHPETQACIQGFTIPHWDQVIALCQQLSSVVPELRYVGWDIAIRKDDVVFIEGNWLPGHDIMQLPAYCPDGFGVYPNIIKAIG